MKWFIWLHIILFSGAVLAGSGDSTSPLSAPQTTTNTAPALNQGTNAPVTPKVETNHPSTLADLRQRFESIVNHTQYAGGFWGVKVISLDSGVTLYEHNAGKLLSPASNSKLYTVALALHRLGPDYRIKTSLYSETRPTASGVLTNDLIIYGRCDPTIKPSSQSGDVLAALQPLVAALTNAGVRSLEGNLIADASFLRGPEFGSGWSWDDQQYYYGAELSALTLNDNILLATVEPGEQLGDPCDLSFNPPLPDLQVINRTTTAETNSGRTISFYKMPSSNILYVSGKLPLGGKPFTEDVTVHNPAAMFAELFAQALENNGVEVLGDVVDVNWLDRIALPFKPDEHVELGNVLSLPLSEIASRIQKPSQNLYTDLLLAHLGETRRTASTPDEKTSEELGITEMQRFLSEVGIPRSQYFLEEGSGLSRDNLVTPSATVALLRFMSKQPTFEVYKAALPVAGVDGTLRNRMKDTPAAGNVRAKTGSLRWASSLSGYVTSASGEHLAFCFMVNRFHTGEPARSPRADLDAMAAALAGFTGKSTE